jgi:hypothetical protein
VHEVDFSTDLSPSAWIGPRLLPWNAEVGTRVASVVPAGYAAYLRILHPASRNDQGEPRPVRWREIAAWSGRVYHPLVQFDRLSLPGDTTAGPPPHAQPPATGRLPQQLCEDLFQALAAWTTTPQVCWLGIWEGWGSLQYSRSSRLVAGRRRDRDGSEVQEARSSADEAESRLAEVAKRARWAPRFSHPHRRYLLARAPFTAVCGLGGFPLGITPSLAWPADRSWCLATEVDFDSTLVAAGDACAAALMADDTFEALPVRPEDRLDLHGDLLNAADR